MGSIVYRKALEAVPSAMIRSDYNAFSKLCHESGEPVLVTRNGAGDLVVMSQEAYNGMIESMALAMELMAADRALQAGTPTIPAADVFAALRGSIHENTQN